MSTQARIREFMERFLRRRTEALALSLEAHRLFWQQYFLPNVRFDSRLKNLENTADEKVVVVCTAEQALSAISERPPMKWRYHLVEEGPQFRIAELEYSCWHEVFGSVNECSVCGGSGWIALQAPSNSIIPWKGRTALHEFLLRAAEPKMQRIPPEIQVFISKFFAERSASRRRELEIRTEALAQFYQDGTKLIEWSCAPPDADKILWLKKDVGEIQLVTEGVFGMWHRYHLVPNQALWLFSDVDFECPLCRSGPKKNCSTCHGTGWHSSKN